MQSGPKAVPFNIPVHLLYGCGLLNLRLPIGGKAYGIFRNWYVLAPGILMASIPIPVTSPEGVVTVRWSQMTRGDRVVMTVSVNNIWNEKQQSYLC